MVPRNAAAFRTTAISTGTQSNYKPAIRPPYTNASLDRFEDCFRSDMLVQNGIVKRAELVLGRHGKIVMDTTEEFDTEDDRANALKKVQDNPKYVEARKKVQKVQNRPGVDFHNKLKAGVIQSKTYGRAALEEAGLDADGLPTALHVLNSKRLGQVEIDPVTWAFLGVHYLDLQKGSTGMDDVLDADSLIYLANRDYHVSPGSLYYGLSNLEGIVDGSDSKRIAKQEDIKEIMKSNWAPFLILKFNNPNISVQQMQDVVNNLAPGQPFGHKQDMEASKIDLQSDLQKITEAVDFLNRESLRELGVPAFVAGYENIVNYANSQQVLLAYKEIELESDRTWIKDIVQPQWLNRLFYRLLDINLDAGDEPEVKLSYEFEDVSFETTLDIVNRDLLLYDRQLISGEKVLKDAGYDDAIEEYKLLQEQQRLEQQARMQMFLQQQRQNQQQQQQQQQEGGQTPQQQGQQNQQQPPQLENRPFGRGMFPTVRQPSVTASGLSPSTTVRKRSGSSSSVDRELDNEILKKFSDAIDKISES